MKRLRGNESALDQIKLNRSRLPFRLPAKDRVGSRRLRTVTLPHHRTCGFPHPAVEPGSVTTASYHVMKPLALPPWSFHSAPLRCISSGAGLLPLGRFLQADPLLYSPLA